MCDQRMADDGGVRVIHTRGLRLAPPWTISSERVHYLGWAQEGKRLAEIMLVSGPSESHGRDRCEAHVQ